LGDSDAYLPWTGLLERAATGVLRICTGRRLGTNILAAGWFRLLRSYVLAVSTLGA
jgi:hypothetical protein